MEAELCKRIEQLQEFSLTEFKNILRRYKYEEYLRITVRDIAQLCPFKETLDELSAIAICSLRTALIGITKYELGKNNFQENLINRNEIGTSVEVSKSAQNSESIDFFPIYDIRTGEIRWS